MWQPVLFLWRSVINLSVWETDVYVHTLNVCIDFTSPTVVEIAKIASIEEEVGSEEVTKSPTAWTEGQRCVQVESPSPVGLPPQVVTWNASYWNI